MCMGKISVAFFVETSMEKETNTRRSLACLFSFWEMIPELLLSLPHLLPILVEEEVGEILEFQIGLGFYLNKDWIVIFSKANSLDTFPNNRICIALFQSIELRIKSCSN